MKTIGNTIYYLILAALAGVTILLALSLMPNTIGIQFLTVQSGSMEPALQTGSVIVVRPANEYHVGDIITYTTGPNRPPTTHRVIDISNENGQKTFTTKGDANEEQDLQHVSEGSVLGSVRLHIPHIGHVISFARTTTGLILLILIPTLVIIGDEIRKIFRETRRIRLSNDKS